MCGAATVLAEAGSFAGPALARAMSARNAISISTVPVRGRGNPNGASFLLPSALRNPPPLLPSAAVMTPSPKPKLRRRLWELVVYHPLQQSEVSPPRLERTLSFLKAHKQ